MVSGVAEGDRKGVGAARDKNAEGLAAYQRKTFEEAARLFSEAAELLLQAAGAQGDADDDALSGLPSAQRKELAVVLMNRAKSRLAVGAASAAVRDAARAVGLDRRFAKAHITLAEAYRAEGMLSEAADAITEGLRAIPEDPGLIALRAELPRDRASADEKVKGETRLDVRLTVLPRLIRVAAGRLLLTYSVALVLLAFVLWMHRRPLAHAWTGAEEPLTLENLQFARRFWAGYGIGGSFSARLHIESAVEAGFQQVQWKDSLEKLLRKNGGRTVGNFVMLSWRLEGAAKAKRKGGQKPTCRLADNQICVLGFLPGTGTSVGKALKKLQNHTVRGSLARLSRTNQAWLWKSGWNGDGIQPLFFSIRHLGKEQPELFLDLGAEPDNLVWRRLALALAVGLAVVFARGMVAATLAYRDFTRHPSFRKLRAFSDVGVSALAVAQEIERELADVSLITGRRSMQNDHVIITCTWLVHSPTVWTYLDRLLQPLKVVVAVVLQPSARDFSILGDNAGDKKSGIFEAICYSLKEWVQLVRCSAPCGVEISHLRDCNLGTRVAMALDLGPNWDTLRLAAQRRLVLWDSRLGPCAEIFGTDDELKKLAREVSLRQAVDRQAAGEAGGFFSWGDSKLPVDVADPLSMPLDRCYHALGVSRRDVQRARSPQGAKLLLRRAFRARALATHPDKAGEDPQSRAYFEQAALAIGLLQRRLDSGLQM